MKGITHFAVGVAAASCFPQAVQAAVQGNPLHFVLGGVCGLLPDTLDFKVYKFFHRRDIEVAPDPLDPDPEMIAQALAYAVERTHRTNKATLIKLNTIRLGADRWQQYLVRFDVPGRRVVVALGPHVNTGRTPLHDTPQRDAPAEVSADLPCPVALDYQAATAVDIFDGPTFRMASTLDGRVRLHFIPWHREWSHSLVIALLAALAGWVAWGPVAGMVMFTAWSAHTLFDQLGFMGSNLLFPFTQHRSPGWQRVHSDDGSANATFTWCTLVLIFWNLYRIAPLAPSTPRFNAAQIALFGAVLPVVAARALRRVLKPRVANEA